MPGYNPKVSYDLDQLLESVGTGLDSFPGVPVLNAALANYLVKPAVTAFEVVDMFEPGVYPLLKGDPKPMKDWADGEAIITAPLGMGSSYAMYKSLQDPAQPQLSKAGELAKKLGKGILAGGDRALTAIEKFVPTALKSTGRAYPPLAALMELLKSKPLGQSYKEWEEQFGREPELVLNTNLTPRPEGQGGAFQTISLDDLPRYPPIM